MTEDHTAHPHSRIDAPADLPPAHAPRDAPRRPTVREWMKTGHPLAWLGMKATETRYEFDPDYVVGDGEKGPLLQRPSKYGLRNFRCQDLHLETGESVTAWYKKAAPGFPTIVYCHGNASSLDARLMALQEFDNRGFGVMIAAYPGFKSHRRHVRVQPSEKACYATGSAMVRYLMNHKGIQTSDMVLFGESLGSAVALRTAYDLERGAAIRDEPPMEAPPVVCWAAFTSLVKRAKEAFPLLPADMLMDNRFESDRIIADIKAPILLMHGLEDTYTPPHHSEDLQRITGGKAELGLLEGCNHTATLPGDEARDPAQIKLQADCLQDFLHRLGKCPPTSSAAVPFWRARVRSGGTSQEFRRA